MSVMKLPIACLSLWFLLGVPVLAVLSFNHGGLFPPPPGWDNREAQNSTQDAPDQDPWQQVLSRLDVLEAARESERSKYGEIKNTMNSMRKDVARHSSGIARMDIFAETVLQRLLALEGKQTEKDTRIGTEQVPPLCLTSSPPSRQSAEFNKTVTGSSVVAKYKCKYGYFNIGGDVHVSKCDAEGKWSKVDISCNNFTTCSYRYGSRMVYGGTHSTTKKGHTCQKWSSFKPHSHGYAKPILFSRTTWTGPESLDDVANYCRDPGLMKGSGKLWCYTTDPRHRWEKCKVPECTVT